MSNSSSDSFICFMDKLKNLPREHLWFNDFLSRCSPTYRIIFRMAAEIGLDTVLSIQILDTIRGGCFVRVTGDWGSAEITDELWLDAEYDLFTRRQDMIRCGESPPSSGPFFYDDLGHPITTHSIISYIHERLENLRLFAEERKRNNRVTSNDRYYSVL